MLRKLHCTGWCNRAYINTNGLPSDVVLKCFLRQKCVLCQNTTPIRQPTQQYPSPSRSPQPVPLLSSYKHRRRLYKKLKARHPPSFASKLENTKPRECEYEGSEDEEDDDMAQDEIVEEDISEEEPDEPVLTGVLQNEDEESMASEEEEEEEVFMEDELPQRGGSWEPPCCCLCGETTNSTFCRQCSNYIRSRARPLVFFNR